ncbi:MAG: cupin domain-containing protein [Marinilabiliales bacterium]|nr:cupin domain-containing protein [Marinilabiliales bacterium]
MKPLILLWAILATLGAAAQNTPKDSAKTSGSYSLKNCFNHFDKDKVVPMAAGYQYWFIDKDFLPDGLTVKMSVVAPGKASHAPHHHAGDEIFFVLEGEARFYLNGETTTGGPQTTFYCPENSEHGISNAGDKELKYLVIRKYPKGEK